MATVDYCARIGWVGMEIESSVCFATSTEVEARADFSRLAQQQTGAALCWKNSVMWSCSKMPGVQRPTIPARKPALWKPT